MSAPTTAVKQQAAGSFRETESQSAADAKIPLFGTAVALFLVAVVVYVPLIGWGVPEATTPDRIKTVATDEILPLEGLAEMHNTFVVSKPDRNYGYPWFHYFETAVVQAPYLAYAKLSGQWGSPAPDYPFGFRDPVLALRWLTWLGRLLSVLMGAGIVVATFLFARNLWGSPTGLPAAILVMLSYPMVYYSRTGNPDVPSAFWGSLGLVAYAAILREGITNGRAVCLGISAGIAMATKDQAVLIFVPLGISLLFWSRPWRVLVLALTASIAAYAIAAGMLVDPHRHIEHVYRILFNPSLTNSMGFYRPGHPDTWDGTVAMVREFFQGMNWMYAPPVLLAALAGAWATVRREPRLLVLTAPLVLLYFGLVMPVRTLALRYFLPMAPIVCGFAAAGVLAIGRSRIRWAAAPAFVLLCAWEVAIAADLTYAQARETRNSAAAWLREHVKPGERIEYFGVREAMPPLPALIPSRRIAGRVEWKRESGHGPRILEYLATAGPEYVFITPDVTSEPGKPYSGDCPPEVFDALVNGRTPYVLAASFATPSLLPGWLQRPRLDYPSVSPPVRIFERRRTLP